MQSIGAPNPCTVQGSNIFGRTLQSTCLQVGLEICPVGFNDVFSDSLWWAPREQGYVCFLNICTLCVMIKAENSKDWIWIPSLFLIGMVMWGVALASWKLSLLICEMGLIVPILELCVEMEKHLASGWVSLHIRVLQLSALSIVKAK